MGLEVPFHFGGRMTGAVRNRNAMTEAIVANDPALGEAFEAGVDVRLGVAAWSLVTPWPGVAWVGPGAGWAKPVEDEGPWSGRPRPAFYGPGPRVWSPRPIRMCASARRFRSTTFSAFGRPATSTATSRRSGRATSPR